MDTELLTQPLDWENEGKMKAPLEKGAASEVGVEPLYYADEKTLNKLVQRKADKITSKLGKEKAVLQKRIETLAREKCVAEERMRLDIAEKEKKIALLEKALKEKENWLYGIKAIKEAGLDNGSDNSLALVEILLGENETATDLKIKAFREFLEQYPPAEVSKMAMDVCLVPTAKRRKRSFQARKIGSVKNRKS